MAASLVLFSLFFFPMVNNLILNGHADSITAAGIYEVINGVRTKTSSFILLSLATVVAGLLPLAGIFLYKNRKRQISYCYIVIVLLIGYSFYSAETVKTIAGDVTLRSENYGLGIILPSLAIVLLFLAIRGINRDEKLVRSADRLR